MSNTQPKSSRHRGCLFAVAAFAALAIPVTVGIKEKSAMDGALALFGEAVVAVLGSTLIQRARGTPGGQHSYLYSDLDRR